MVVFFSFLGGGGVKGGERGEGVCQHNLYNNESKTTEEPGCSMMA